MAEAEEPGEGPVRLPKGNVCEFVFAKWEEYAACEIMRRCAGVKFARIKNECTDCQLDGKQPWPVAYASRAVRNCGRLEHENKAISDGSRCLK